MVSIVSEDKTGRFLDEVLAIGRAALPIACSAVRHSHTPGASFIQMPSSVRWAYCGIAVAGILNGTLQLFRSNEEVKIRSYYQAHRFLSQEDMFEPLVEIVAAGFSGTAALFLPFLGKTGRSFAPTALVLSTLIYEAGMLYDTIAGPHQKDGWQLHTIFTVGFCSAALALFAPQQTRLFKAAIASTLITDLVSSLEVPHQESWNFMAADIDMAHPSPLPAACPVQKLPTGKDIMQDHDYGPIGYYARKDIKPFSYVSHVEINGPYYGQMMANKLRKIFEQMRSNGQIPDGGRFAIYEHGGWDGRLARDILTYARKRAESDKDPAWQLFYASLDYYDVEISNVGFNLQKNLETEFPEHFQAICADAITYRPSPSVRGVVISVLMIDSFPLYQIVGTESGARPVFPTPQFVFSDFEEKQNFLATHFPGEEQAVEEESNNLRKTCFMEFPYGDIDLFLFLGRDRFRQLQSVVSSFYPDHPVQYAASLHQINERMGFAHGTAPVDAVPEVRDFLERHPKYKNVPPGEFAYLNTDFDKYVENLKTYLDVGALITADIMSIAPFNVMGGSLSIRPVLTGQSEKWQGKLDYVSAADFGRLLVFQGLDPTDFHPAFGTNAHYTVTPQQELWQYFEGDQDNALTTIQARLVAKARKSAEEQGMEKKMSSKDWVDVGNDLRQAAKSMGDGYYVLTAYFGEGWKNATSTDFSR